MTAFTSTAADRVPLALQPDGRNLPLQQDSRQWVANAQVTLGHVQLGKDWLPTTESQSDQQNTYVCSVYAQYIRYAKEELDLLPSPWQRVAGWLGLSLLGGLLKIADSENAVQVNNALLSTNSWPEHPPTQANWLAPLIAEHPRKAIILRNLNSLRHREWLESCAAHKCLLIPTRQIYLFEPHDQTWTQRNNFKNDQRLLRNTAKAGELIAFSHADLRPEDYPVIKACFDQLFLDKHSRLNPHYTLAWMKQMAQRGRLEFFGYRDPQGEIIAVSSLMTQFDELTVPVLGYRTDLPKEIGLYRLLIAQTLNHAKNRKQWLNLSSGAGAFKTLRGGEASLESMAVYVDHLPWTRRLAWRLFARIIEKTLPPLLEKHTF
jgi:hypothetical protein